MNFGGATCGGFRKAGRPDDPVFAPVFVGITFGGLVRGCGADGVPDFAGGADGEVGCAATVTGVAGSAGGVGAAAGLTGTSGWTASGTGTVSAGGAAAVVG